MYAEKSKTNSQAPLADASGDDRHWQSGSKQQGKPRNPSGRQYQGIDLCHVGDGE